MPKEKGNLNDTKIVSDEFIGTIENKKENEEPKKNNQLTEKQNFTVFAVPCNRVFILDPEKVEEFEKQISDPENIAFVKKCADSFRKSDLAQRGRVLKKVKKSKDK